VLVLVKSLDKFYLQRISALIAEAKLDEIHRIRRRRAVLTVTLCVGFCTAIIAGGRPLLASFGPGFERGYPALCLVAVATSAWTLTSLSQWLIAFIDGPGAALRITLGGVFATYLAIVVLGPSWGLMGVALAYSVMVTVMAALLELRARAILRRLATET
jgi:O-antigen/teichoic acid export membrane protein